MISSRILEIVTNLTEEQLNSLMNFLKSPYHNSGYNSQKIIELFALIEKAVVLKQMDGLEKKVLNQYFYSDHPFVEKKKNPIDALASDLFNKVKDFLFFEHIKSSRFATQRVVALSQFYRINNFEDRFWQTIKQFRKKNLIEGHRDAYYYLDTFLVEAEVAAFSSTFNTYSDDANIDEAEYCLDQFYATQKLENTAILVFQRKLSDKNLNEKMQTASVLTKIYSDYPSFHTPLANYYHTILAWIHESPTPAALEEFVSSLKAQESAIEPSKFRNLMAFYRYFRGVEYRREATGVMLLQKVFKVYRDHLEAGYLEVNGKLMPATLKSIVNLAIKVGEIDWVKEVLRDYSSDHLTGTRYPAEAHSVCEAEVLFANHEYEKALHKLTYCNFENVNYSILADLLLIKIYYVQEDELVYNRISALEKKVRRSKLSEHNKSAYLNFLRLLLRILKYEHDKSSKKWIKLEEDFQNTLPMLEREWLRPIIKA